MLTPMLEQIASLARLDFSPQHRQPLVTRVLLATVIAIAGSLAVDAILVAIGEAVFPGTKGYVHFRFSDYAKLTVIGVIIACAAWPVITRVSSAATCSSTWRRSARPATQRSGHPPGPLRVSRGRQDQATWSGSGAGMFPAAGSAAGPSQCRQMSRCTGMSRGMSRSPGMNGTHSSKMVATPVM